MSAASGPRPRRNGQPLVALAGILACWIGARAALFEMPPELLAHGALTVRAIAEHAGSPAAPAQAARRSVAAASRPRPLAEADLAIALPSRLLPVLSLMPATPAAAGVPAPRPGIDFAAAGHNLSWIAAMQATPLTPELGRALHGAAPLPVPRTAPSAPRARWSGDGWLVLRQGGSEDGPAGLSGPVYGGSQAGAVLRYSLAPASLHRPALYVRAVRAIGSAGAGDLAAGLTARPLAALPVTAHLEARATRRGDGGATILRPVAFLAAGLDEAALPLPLGLRARGYAQAGYVGGRAATAFADGSLTAERPVVEGREASLAAGAGLWGGAQRGAGRLDLGPSASLRFRLGEGSARLALDYRLRVAGNAEPAAGAALTLSAGF